MAKYLFLYRSPMSDAPPPSPEQMQAIMAVWNAWIDKFKKSGQLLDPGDGLTPAGKVVRSGVVSDGPFVEAKELLGGYSIIQAKDFNEAVLVAKECPAAHHGSLEIREFAGWI